VACPRRNPIPTGPGGAIGKEKPRISEWSSWPWYRVFPMAQDRTALKQPGTGWNISFPGSPGTPGRTRTPPAAQCHKPLPSTISMKLGTRCRSPQLTESQRANPPQTAPNTATSSRPASPGATPHAAQTLTNKPRHGAGPRQVASGSFIGESVSRWQVWWSWRYWVGTCSMCRAGMSLYELWASPIYNVSGGMGRKRAQPTSEK
jgi:hypothetical protein